MDVNCIHPLCIVAPRLMDKNILLVLKSDISRKSFLTCKFYLETYKLFLKVILISGIGNDNFSRNRSRMFILKVYSKHVK